MSHRFGWISIGRVLSLPMVSFMLAHLIPHLTNGLGYVAVRKAGLAFALMTGVQMAAYCSAVSKQLLKELYFALCMVGHCIGLLMVTYASSPIWILVLPRSMGLPGVFAARPQALRADY